MDYSWPGCPWDFPDRNTGVGCIPFPTQRLNSSLLHWQTGSWLMSHQRSPLLFRFQLKRRSWLIWSIKTFKTPSISVIRLSHFLINHVFTGVALFKNLFLGIGVLLTSHAVTVSGEQWRDSVTHASFAPKPPRHPGCHVTLGRAARAVQYVPAGYSSYTQHLHMATPKSLTSYSSGNHEFVLQVCELEEHF